MKIIFYKINHRELCRRKLKKNFFKYWKILISTGMKIKPLTVILWFSYTLLLFKAYSRLTQSLPQLNH